MDQPQTDYQARANDNENTTDATYANIPAADPPMHQPQTDYQARANDDEKPDATYAAIPDDPLIDQPRIDHQARANDDENTPDATHPTIPDGACPGGASGRRGVCSFLRAHRSCQTAGIAVLLGLCAVGLAPLTFSNKQLFQRRQDGSVDFYRGWADYRTGFPSNLNGEFWLGNDNLYRLAVQKVYQLRVDMEDVEGNMAYAAFDTFAISPQSQNYKLLVGNYSGTAGDSLTYHDGKPFSTKDRKNEDYHASCAQRFKGAWWYYDCQLSNLNGLYHLGEGNNNDGVTWYHWKGEYYSLKRTEMKLRSAAP
ncbi:PREDICTED: ficolin-1-like [Branchiostoma belcheri]|uniref:Ficolin-1-like n=1 Tax=Branchiostoma belcheri TaxID=7741 RepID=A0A6P4YS00_BRABE|nr:PREDICTED: ficolin-1-like [Branchiostoma belcheri]